eukprot:TRINITY_DN13529_c0_g1_i1.p1 TRINITY_DN13529_c0_g1~~TRINITY_DN13529_c0_g1_i1.p1  ORF type:complete len:188 (+),score=20.54 TRINITY_DN13529_c0_g1_i1:244-807(+)
MVPPNDPIVVDASHAAQSIKEALDKVKAMPGEIQKLVTHFPLVQETEQKVKVVVGMVAKSELLELVHADACTTENVKRVADMHPLTVRKEFPLQMAYQLFKSMDMKNLVVVNDDHSPYRVMTRFAFLAWVVDQRLPAQRRRELQELENTRVTMRRRSSLSSTPGNISPSGGVSLTGGQSTQIAPSNV